MNPILALTGTFAVYLAAKRRISKYAELIKPGPSATNPAQGTAPDTGTPLSVSGVTSKALDHITDLVKKFGGG